MLYFIPLQSFLSRLCGADWCPRWVPAELLFSLPLAWAAYLTSGHSYGWGALGWAIGYVGMQIGHSNIYHMGAEEYDWPYDPDTIDTIIKPFTDRLGIAPRSAPYCWIGMGIKGFLIGLPAWPYGVFLALLWPFSYYASFVLLKRGSMPGEWIAGACAGLVCYAAT